MQENGAVVNGGSVKMTGCTVSNNAVTQNGGVMFTSGPVLVNSCIFTNNTCYTWDADSLGRSGGVIYSESTVDIRNSRFTASTAFVAVSLFLFRIDLFLSSFLFLSPL